MALVKWKRRPPSFRRAILVVLVCVAVGVVATIMLSWGAAVRITANATGDVAERRLHWGYVAQRTTSGARVYHLRHYYWPPGSTTIRMSSRVWSDDSIDAPAWLDLTKPSDKLIAYHGEVIVDPNIDVVENRSIVACGWPMLALWGDTAHSVGVVDHLMRDPNPHPRPVRELGPSGGIALSRTSTGEQIVLPTRPIMGGILVNTMVFAAPLWLIVGGPFAFREAWRARLRRKCGESGGDGATDDRNAQRSTQ